MAWWRSGLVTASVMMAACSAPPATTPMPQAGQEANSAQAYPEFVVTHRYLDLALQGGTSPLGATPRVAMPDYFVLDGDGVPPSYTRWGVFTLDSARAIVHETGQTLVPRITVPADARDLVIREDGLVLVTRPGTDAQQELGALQTARFADPTGLKTLGDGRFVATGASGAPELGRPATEGRGLVKQGLLTLAERATWGTGSASRAAGTITAPWRPFARRQTEKALDLKVDDPDGRHMLTFASPKGEVLYAPGMALVRAEGSPLRSQGGGLLMPAIRIPAETAEMHIHITVEGVVTAQVANRYETAGRIDLVRFPPGAVLQRLMTGEYRLLSAGVAPEPVAGGDGAALAQGFLPDLGSL